MLIEKMFCWQKDYGIKKKHLFIFIVNLYSVYNQKKIAFFSFLSFNWRLITLQYCDSFCHTLTWISHGCTCVPHPDPPSHLPPHHISQDPPSAPALSTLPHASNLDWWSISHMIINMFQHFHAAQAPRTTPSFLHRMCVLVPNLCQVYNLHLCLSLVKQQTFSHCHDPDEVWPIGPSVRVEMSHFCAVQDSTISLKWLLIIQKVPSVTEKLDFYFA